MAEQKRDYYEVLGVSKNASDADIKRAYRKLAKENHPDLHPGDKACEARFKEANEAYEVLSNPDKKAKYDQFGFAGPITVVRAAMAAVSPAISISAIWVIFSAVSSAAGSAAGRPGATARCVGKRSGPRFPSVLRKRLSAAKKKW